MKTIEYILAYSPIKDWPKELGFEVKNSIVFNELSDFIHENHLFVNYISFYYGYHEFTVEELDDGKFIPFANDVNDFEKMLPDSPIDAICIECANCTDSVCGRLKKTLSTDDISIVGYDVIKIVL